MTNGPVSHTFILKFGATREKISVELLIIKNSNKITYDSGQNFLEDAEFFLRNSMKSFYKF